MSNCRCRIEYQSEDNRSCDSAEWCYRPCTSCDMKRIPCGISKVDCSSRSYCSSRCSFDNSRDFDHILSSEDRKLAGTTNCYGIKLHDCKIICLAIERNGLISLKNNTCVSNNWCCCIKRNREWTCVLNYDDRYYWCRGKNLCTRSSNCYFESCHSRKGLIDYSV